MRKRPPCAGARMSERRTFRIHVGGFTPRQGPTPDYSNPPGPPRLTRCRSLDVVEAPSPLHRGLTPMGWNPLRVAEGDPGRARVGFNHRGGANAGCPTHSSLRPLGRHDRQASAWPSATCFHRGYQGSISRPPPEGPCCGWATSGAGVVGPACPEGGGKPAPSATFITCSNSAPSSMAPTTSVCSLMTVVGTPRTW
jgi:hypothetical protein